MEPSAPLLEALTHGTAQVILGAIVMVLVAVVGFLFREMKKDREAAAKREKTLADEYKAETEALRKTCKAERDELFATMLEIEQKRVHDARDLQQARVSDLDTMNIKLVKLIESQGELLANATTTLEMVREALVEQRGAFRTLADDVRRRQ